MKSRLVILTCLLLVSCSNAIKIRNNNKTYYEWRKNIFYPNRYEIIVWGIFNIGNEKYGHYIGGDFLVNQDSTIISNLYLKNIKQIKKGDTLIKPKNSYHFYIKKDRRLIPMKYKWSWERFKEDIRFIDENEFEKIIIKGFRKWEKTTFFSEHYIAVVDSFDETKWEKYIPNRKYLEVHYLSENDDGIPFDKMILKNIHMIKKGDTLIKPSFSNDLYIIDNGQKVKLNYQWRWNMKEKIL